MNSLLLIVIPLLAAGLSLWWRDERSRPWLLPATGLVHLLLCLALMRSPPALSADAWLGFDALAAALLPAVSLLFLFCGFYAVPYLRQRRERPNRLFVTCLLAVLGLISAGHQARHVGLLWIATETLTLCAVPLLHFSNTPRAFEATWKYLLVGGTGIALSLLGSFCLGYASLHGGGGGDLTFAALVAQGPQLTLPWTLVAWVLLLTGYGTKMGLAPMHTWKPDAYGEASGIVGALMAGGVTSVAFSAVLRFRAVVHAAGAGAVADRSLVCVGLLSMAVAALFLLGTRNYKRMLAYSSIEHMGILSIGAGLGPLGTAAALFHTWSNALTKGALFMCAGNIRRAAGSPSLDRVRGFSHILPRTSGLLIVGMFAITACPPFAPFFSELTILQAAGREAGAWLVAGVLLCLLFAFFGLSRIVFALVDGRPSAQTRAVSRPFRETRALLLPATILLGLSLWLGLFTPTALKERWALAVTELFPAP